MLQSVEEQGMRTQGTVTIVVSIVFLLIAVWLWRTGNVFALSAAIIFLAWGLHGILRGVLNLREARESEERD